MSDTKSNSEIPNEQERDANLPPLEHNQDDSKMEPVTPALELSSEDMQKVAEASGVSIEDLNLKGQSASKYDRERNDMVASDGKLVSEVVKPEDLANYNQVLEGLKTEGAGIWAYVNEKGDKEISISKVDAEGNVQTYFFEVKTETVELFDISDSSDFEAPNFLQIEGALGNRVDNQKLFDVTSVVGPVRITARAQRETAVGIADTLRVPLEKSQTTISPESTKILFRPEVVVVEEPGLFNVKQAEVSEPIEISRFNLEDISTEVGTRQVASHIERVQTAIIGEKTEITNLDVQEFGIGLIEQDTEEVDNLEETIEIQVEQPIVVNVKVSQESILVVQSTEVLPVNTEEEGITLINVDDLEVETETVTAEASVAESIPAKVTFAAVETDPAYIPEGKVTFPVGEVSERSSAKVTFATEAGSEDAAKTIFAAVETEAVVEVLEQTEAPAAVIFQERNDNQATIVSAVQVEATEAVEDMIETKQVNDVPEKVLTIIERQSETRQQVITPEVQPVVADRIAANNERSERLIVEPQEVQVNLQAEALVESDRVVLFRRAESAEPVREVNERLRVEQVASEPLPRAEQLSNNQSPIQNDSQVQVEEEEFTPQAIRLAA